MSAPNIAEAQAYITAYYSTLLQPGENFIIEGLTPRHCHKSRLDIMSADVRFTSPFEPDVIHAWDLWFESDGTLYGEF